MAALLTGCVSGTYALEGGRPPNTANGLFRARWLTDEIGRRVGFIALLIWGAVFMTLWFHAAADLWLWIFGLGRSFGFLGFWGPSTTLTAEVFATRIRGVANGIVRFIGFFTGFVLGPFATVALQQATGSFHPRFPGQYPHSWSAWPRGSGLSSPSTPARNST